MSGFNNGPAPMNVNNELEAVLAAAQANYGANMNTSGNNGNMFTSSGPIPMNTTYNEGSDPMNTTYNGGPIPMNTTYTEGSAPMNTTYTEGSAPMYTNYSNGPAPNRDRRPIKRYGKRKAWYHHNDLCTWDFVTLAAYLTEDIRNGIDPTIRLDRCIGARQTDIQERQPEQGSQNLRTDRKSTRLNSSHSVNSV